MQNKEKITIVKTDHFSPEQILSSGQCFRMEQTEENVYEVIAGDRYLRIRQTEEPDTCLFYCGEEEYQTFWRRYFDLDGCYEAYLQKIDPADTYLAVAAEYGSGIRILQQDLWEMILTFVISQQNNIFVREIWAGMQIRRGEDLFLFSGSGRACRGLGRRIPRLWSWL